MPFDPEKLPAAMIKRAIALGAQFGSRDTHDQANQALNLRTKYETLLMQHGFAVADWDRLGDLRDLQIAAGVGRDAAKGEKKTTSAGYVKAFTEAQSARLSARSVLEGTHEDLEEAGDDATAQQVSTALEQTVVTPEDGEAMAAQLDTLRKALILPAVATPAASRGGAEAATRLQSAAPALRAADQADTGGRGTPAETARLDLLDGLVVRLTRRARKAAAAAAKATGNAAVVREFRLDKLYRSRGGKHHEDTEEGGGEGSEGEGG